MAVINSKPWRRDVRDADYVIASLMMKKLLDEAEISEIKKMRERCEMQRIEYAIEWNMKYMDEYIRLVDEIGKKHGMAPLHENDGEAAHAEKRSGAEKNLVAERIHEEREKTEDLHLREKLKTELDAKGSLEIIRRQMESNPAMLMFAMQTTDSELEDMILDYLYNYPDRNVDDIVRGRKNKDGDDFFGFIMGYFMASQFWGGNDEQEKGRTSNREDEAELYLAELDEYEDTGMDIEDLDNFEDVDGMDIDDIDLDDFDMDEMEDEWDYDDDDYDGISYEGNVFDDDF